MNWKPDIKGILSPFTALKYLFKRPATLTYPQVKKDAVKGYRGFHINDQGKCIGCGNCEDVCMNVAIDMVSAEEERNSKNTSGLVPRVDYGRCCWCSLCTDVCPTNSLELTPECLLVSEDPNDFLYVVPDPVDDAKKAAAKKNKEDGHE